MKRNSVHFFVAITKISLFDLCLFFLEGEKKREREVMPIKKCTEFRFILYDLYSLGLRGSAFAAIWICLWLNKPCFVHASVSWLNHDNFLFLNGNYFFYILSINPLIKNISQCLKKIYRIHSEGRQKAIL